MKVVQEFSNPDQDVTVWDFVNISKSVVSQFSIPYTNIIKIKMNPDVNLEDCIQDGGTAIPRLVSRLALSLSLSPASSLPTLRSRNSAVFGNVLCADSVTPCRAHPIFWDVDGRSMQPRPLSPASGQAPSSENHLFALSNGELPIRLQMCTWGKVHPSFEGRFLHTDLCHSL